MFNKINIREYRRGNQQWTIQRKWQHRVHKTQDKYMLENTEGVIKNGQYRENGNIGYTTHRTNKRQRIQKGQSKMDNTEKLATQGTQDTGQIHVRKIPKG